MMGAGGTCIYSTSTRVKFHQLHADVSLAMQVKRQGYPNVYGARIPVQSGWNLNKFGHLLRNYHDNKIIEFLRYGWPANRLPQAPSPSVTTQNHLSAREYPDAINQYIEKELRLGAMFGPFSTPPFVGHVAVNPLSTRDKKDSGKKRVIMDLSYPDGASVNDQIPKDSYLGLATNLTYPTVDVLAERIAALGPNCLIFKRDLARAFRQVPLRPRGL